MTEALITNLSKIRALKVISKTSAMRYKGSDMPLPEIARELNVDAVVEGSVLRAGSQVRITAQLIHAATDQHLWAENYQRDLRDILALQSEVARAIAREIEVAVTAEETGRLAGARPIDPEVYELYLRGRYLCGKWTWEEMNRGIQYLQQALDIDPGYAPAHAELASCYADACFFEYLPPLEVYPKAKAAATRAVEIDDRLAEAHTSIGSVNYQLEWSFLEAEQAFKRAIELNPNDSRTLVYYAWMLGETGRFEEAMVPARRSQELDPLSVSANVAVAEIFYLSRNYDEAIKEYSKNLDLSPNDPGVYYFLAWPYEQKGMFEKAIALLERAVRLSEGAPVHVAALGHAYAVAGQRGEALKLLDQLQDPAAPMPASPFHIALVHVGLGDSDSAFQWLEKAYQERALQLIYLKVGPKFDRLRADPRFTDLLRRLNLLDEDTQP
jgi:tetratricopeptide (TPR) repeat protein